LLKKHGRIKAVLHGKLDLDNVFVLISMADSRPGGLDEATPIDRPDQVTKRVRGVESDKAGQFNQPRLSCTQTG
jgi:hypothetical protein